MREILIEKVVVNIGVGQPGDDLEHARDLLSRLAGGRKTVETHAKKRQPTFKLRKGLPIGTKLTLRGASAKEFLEKALSGKRKVLNQKNFDKQGNFAFGIHEYIDFPGAKYDPSMPMFGFDICVSLARKGKRVALRKIKKGSIGKKHKITKEEAIEYAKSAFGIEVE